MSARPSDLADASARLGSWLVIVGVGFLPITVLAVGFSPQGARAAVFLIGLTATATVCIWGGVSARRALSTGTSHPIRAGAAGIIGLLVGITAALVTVWSLVGLIL